MYIRRLYLNKIIPFINKPVIKVITGMRRVGKSYFLKQIQEHLLNKKIPKKRIILINMESLEFDHIKTYQELYREIKNKLPISEKQSYVFIDEIQEISQWQKAILSLFSEKKYDIFITGSNAHLLSSELATLISGRYIEFTIYPLSFTEFIEFHAKKIVAKQQLKMYLKFGGLPGVQHFIEHEADTFQYINAIYNTILLKDIVQRFNIRNVTVFKNVARFLFDNIGNTISAKKIADYLKNQKISLAIDTVQNYAQHLQDAFLLYKVSRFDIKGKKQMEIYEKYYLNDIGIRHALLGYRAMDISYLLENIVFLELKRRDFTVYVGKIGQQEIDFIASKEDETYYIQVAYLLDSAKTFNREISAFDNVPNHYPRILISMDEIITSRNIKGIKHLHLIDFLQNKLAIS